MLKKLTLLLLVVWAARAMECDDELGQACCDCAHGAAAGCLSLALQEGVERIQNSAPSEATYLDSRRLAVAANRGCAGYFLLRFITKMGQGSAVLARRCSEFVASRSNAVSQAPDRMKME